MEMTEALDFARTHAARGVLVTIQGNGRPQISNISYVVDGDGVIRIMVTAARIKAKNLRRDPRASLYVSPDFRSWVVIEGDAELSEVTTRVDDAVNDELVDTFRTILGDRDQPDWEAFRQQMVDEQRLVIRLHPTRAYDGYAGFKTR
jgi:PPOX class probable F420-dependent enzyme